MIFRSFDSEKYIFLRKNLINGYIAHFSRRVSVWIGESLFLIDLWSRWRRESFSRLKRAFICKAENQPISNLKFFWKYYKEVINSKIVANFQNFIFVVDHSILNLQHFEIRPFFQKVKNVCLPTLRCHILGINTFRKKWSTDVSVFIIAIIFAVDNCFVSLKVS